MAGTQGTQGTRGTGYIPEGPAEPQARPQAAAPRAGYLPPMTPLQVSKEQLDYRGELMKGIVKLKEDDLAWHEGLMDTWSTRQIAEAGLNVKIMNALVGNAGQGYIADAMTRQAKAQLMRLEDDRQKNATVAGYYQPDMDAVKRWATGAGDGDEQLRNALSSDGGVKALATIEQEAAKQPDEASAKEAKRKLLYGYLDQQRKADAAQKAVAESLKNVPDAAKFDTILEMSMRSKQAVADALHDDERFADLLPGYYQQTDQSYITAGKITDDQVRAGQERHKRAEEDDRAYENARDTIITGYGLPPETKQGVKDAIAQYHQALGGDPGALNDLMMSVPTPPEIQSGLEQHERELARMDAGPNDGRNAFIRAFNTRAGSNDAFYAWSVAMGFRGGQSTDRAAAFAAQYPELSKPFADAVRADPSLLDKTGGYAKMKAKLKELKSPVGLTGPYRVVHPPKAHTPAESINPDLTGTGGPPGLSPAEVAQGTPGPMAMGAKPEGWTPDDETKFQAWYKQTAFERGLDPNPDSSDQHYNYRMAFRAGAGPDASGHWPSQFKDPTHPNRFVGGVDTTGAGASPGGLTPAPVVPEDAPEGGNVPVQAADSSLANAAQAPAAPPSPSPMAPAPAPAPDAPVVGADGSTPRNRVESRPDGSLVIVRPDGSEMVLSPPGAPGPKLSQPAAPALRVLSLPEESIVAPAPAESRQLPTPGAAIGARLAPAVLPAAPASSDLSPVEERELMLQALRAKYMPLDANGQPVPVGGQ